MRSNQPHYKKSRRQGALDRWKVLLTSETYDKKEYVKEQIKILEEKLKNETKWWS